MRTLARDVESRKKIIHEKQLKVPVRVVSAQTPDAEDWVRGYSEDWRVCLQNTNTPAEPADLARFYL